jgi:hypothetical protein
MIDWLVGLQLEWLALVVVAATAVVTAAIYGLVVALAVGDRARSFKGVSPGMLPPIGLVFGLLVGFLAAGVWDNSDKAQAAVNQEASSLRSAVLLAAGLPAQARARVDDLIRRHIEEAATSEWPAMAHGRATLAFVPVSLAQALDVTLAVRPRDDGQRVAQREVVTALENALDARRQRVIVSEGGINWVKWSGVVATAVLMLFAIAFVHSDDRGSAITAMALFAAATAACIILLASQDRPFGGKFAVKPTVLLQVEPPQR